MFFKLSVLKNVTVLEPPSNNKITDLFTRTPTVTDSEFLWK